MDCIVQDLFLENLIVNNRFNENEYGIKVRSSDSIEFINNTLINNTINKTLQDKPARSEKEKKAFKRVWELFEEHSGKPIPKYEGSLQSKSTWEMIDKAKESDADWAEYLGRVINAFFDIIKNKPKGLECVYDQQVKPHILNGVKIWMGVVNKLPDNTPVRTELTAHEEYRIRNGFV